MSLPDFEWDAEKDEANQRKHGVSFKQAQEAFFDPERIIIEDLEHSGKEPRYFCIGFDGQDVLTVRFTHRGARIRIIGAGYWRKERRYYEKING